MDFVKTARSIKLDDIKQFLTPSGIGGFLVKGLFGELHGLPKGDNGGQEKDDKPSDGREEKGLMKIFHMLSGVFGLLKGAYGRVAGGINKVLPIINISNKPWFNKFSMVYAGAVKAMKVVENPAEALNSGAKMVQGAVGNFFESIKSKVSETAKKIKEKLEVNPTQIMKVLANKAVDMVLNFIITHPPSAILKAIFKAVESGIGESIVDLVRKHIPFADKFFVDSINCRTITRRR